LHGGSFIARGGDEANAIEVSGSGMTLLASEVSALAEGATTANRGLYAQSGTEVTLRGGTFTGISGSDYAVGIANYDDGSALYAEQVVAAGQGEGAGITAGAYGFLGWEGSTAVLRGGTYTGRNATRTWGLRAAQNWSETGNTLTAYGVTAIAQDGSVATYGLSASSDATATISQSTLEGSDTAFADTFSDISAITLTHVHLIGGPVTGDVTCTAVSRGGTFNASGCP
jgi:hypothetical protein